MLSFPIRRKTLVRTQAIIGVAIVFLFIDVTGEGVYEVAALAFLSLHLPFYC
jgi:hypothetical protein